MEDPVELECIRAGSKLRVRVISPGYNPNANCQFPRALRLEGRKFRVPREALRFAAGPQGTFFYRVSTKNIEVIEPTIDTSNLTVYNVSPECVVCMSSESDIVFIPCGHFCTCAECGAKLNRRCPMCRAGIEAMVHSSQL